MNIRLINFIKLCEYPALSGVKKPLNPLELKGLLMDTVKLKNLPKKITVDHHLYKTAMTKKTEVILDPKQTAVIYKKTLNRLTGETVKTPVKINVASSSDEAFDYYHFLEQGTNKEIGYVQFFNSKKAKYSEEASKFYDQGKFSRNYPAFGIKKDRIVIEMAYNHSENSYGGIGGLVDRLAVEYALKNGIKPTSIISEAGFNSHCQHYKRGRRFIPENGKNFNKIVSDLISGSLPNQKITSEQLWDVLMYFPKKMVNALLEETKKNPILRG